MTDGSLSEQDNRFLIVAVEEALKGRGFVEPNPMVGAVVAKNDRLISKGYHALYGGPHAEINALAKAGNQSRGATLYVTLEPCSSKGKTPPCTEAVLAAGIRKVVVGAIDPDPRHKSAGLALLKDAGVEVVHANDGRCDSLLQDFRGNLSRKTPYVILKWAMTLDGRIAARDGSSQWISGEASRRRVHRLRGHVDGIMVGSGTAIADDPSLNCRLPKAPLVPTRVVVDPALETPESIGLIDRALKREDDKGFALGPVVFFCSPQADPVVKGTFIQKGVEVITLPVSHEDQPGFLEEALICLKQKGISRLLVEGGSGLITHFIENRLADQIEVYVAPKIVGGEEALSPVGGAGQASMADAIPINNVITRRVGDDLWFRGFF